MDSPISPGTNRTVHTTVLDDSCVGLSITLLSQAASILSRPLYREGDPVAGTVHLNVRKKRRITFVDVTVRLREAHAATAAQPIQLEGRYGVSGAGSGRGSCFLERTTRIWPPPINAPEYTGVYERELRGTSVHYFDFQLPAHCTVDGNVKTRLPPTFRMSLLWVDYELKCTVGRGRFILDEVLSIPIQYRPQTVAGLGSSYRLQAYESGMPIPGPDLDDAGWRTERTMLHGDFFAQRPVEIASSFSLAEPLAYPRGFPIPFAAELACGDAQLIDVLSARGATVLAVTLVRHVAGGDAPDVTDVPAAGARSWITHRDRARGCVNLAGELRAPAWLQPSFSFSGIAVQYYVRCAISAPGLQLSGQLADVPITICARPAPGPLPVSYARQMLVLGDAPSEEPETTGWNFSEKSGMLASYAMRLPMPRAADC